MSLPTPPSLATLAAIVVAGAGAGVAIAATNSSPTASVASKGVSVLYAGSLEALMENHLGPAFAKFSSYGFTGYGGGSNELANEVKGGVRQGDVFVSASPAADTELVGGKNGSWVLWYSTFATSQLELSYNPKTKFGKELEKGVPWYKVITQQGIRVGRTEPKLDPKGRLTVEAVESASKKLHDPALKKALGSFPVYPETALVGRLQAGQLDAGFFYAIEASVAKFPAVPLRPVRKYAEYTITVLGHSPNPGGAGAFVRYLLSPQRASTLKRAGLRRVKPAFHGKAGAVPKSLRKVVGAP